MLPKVSVHATSIENYRELVGDELADELRDLARDLQGVRICHLNSTSFGGGVAELLARCVPLAASLGISTDWRLLQGTHEFFRITKALHNSLQGSSYVPSEDDKALYLGVNQESAKALGTQYDVIVVHDPQPAPLRELAGHRETKWIWRCHIDTSSPNQDVAAFLLPYLAHYDALVFTMKEFVLPGLEHDYLAFIAPGIDPLSTKNMAMPGELCQDILRNTGIDLDRPLAIQVSRFDRWKDPLGVIEAYRLAKEEIAGLQLALIGALAADDPEGFQLLACVEDAALHDKDIFAFTNLAGFGSVEVNAAQRCCDVVIQKSLREGFGLVVSESFWKERAIVAGHAGGIPMQFPPHHERFLISNTHDCAERIVELLTDQEARAAFGKAAREHVRTQFLLPRMLRDDLRVIKRVLGV
jgi:trehalose synthase